MIDPFAALVPPYEVILVDPPWTYYGSRDKWGAAAKFYPTMTDLELTSLPIASLLADKSVLFCWATSARIDFTIECLGHWGLSFRGIQFVWVKTKKDGTPLGAQGVRPSIVKPICEYVVAGSKVRRGRPLPLSAEDICQTVFAPKAEHSTKPEAVQERIEQMYPTARKLELFARKPREGWDAWGDEVTW